MPPPPLLRLADALDLPSGRHGFRLAIIAGLCLLALCDIALIAALAAASRAGGDTASAAWIRALRTLDLPGSALIVEITEQVLMGVEEQVGSRLLQFRDAGIRVALDDFGTGYSSLAYLQRFDVDYLKIDRCFVANLGPESSDQILRDIGCDYGQGYWHARPMTAAQLTERLIAEAARPA